MGWVGWTYEVKKEEKGKKYLTPFTNLIGKKRITTRLGVKTRFLKGKVRPKGERKLGQFLIIFPREPKLVGLKFFKTL